MKSFEERKAEVMLRSEKIIKKRKKRNKIILTLVPLVVCLCALSVTAVPTVFSGKKNTAPESSVNETASETENEIAVLEDNVTVYYVSENGIKSVVMFLPCTPEDIFSAWKEKNGIGDEVKLIKTEIKDNSTTESSEIGGSQVITHTVGDYFILNITVSKTIENYYSAYGEDLLKESLKKTMTGYTDIRYDEYHLYLE